MINVPSRAKSSSFLLLAAILQGSAIAQCPTQWTPGDAGGTDGEVTASVAWDPDGPGPLPTHIVYGGDFHAGGSLLVDNIVMRHPVSGQWSPIGTGLQGGGVRSLFVAGNGELIAGGDFTSAAGVATAHIARWNGSSWTALGLGTNGTVADLVELPNGDLVAVGSFQAAGGAPASCVARWNGSTWSPLGSGVSGLSAYLTAVALAPNGDVFVAGNFSVAGTVSAAAVARWNGTAWSSVGAGFPGLVGTDLLVRANGNVVLGLSGGFVQTTQTWNGTAWTAFGTPLAMRVKALATLANGWVVAAGAADFGQAGASVGAIAAWTGTSWQSFGTGPDGDVSTVAALGTDFTVGGLFTMVQGIGASNVAGWRAVGGWQSYATGVDAPVHTLLTLANGDLVAGGAFTTLQGQTVNHIARFDGIGWHPLGSGMNDEVNALVQLPNGNLVAGGLFTVAGGVAAMGIAQWNGVSWTPLPGLMPGVYGLTVLPNHDLVAAGVFGSANVAQWNGVSWTPLPGIGPPVWTVAALPDGSILAGSDGGVQRWTGSWNGLGGGVNGSVRALQVLPGGDVIAGGWFTTAGGLPVNRVARWNGSSWSAFGSPAFEFVNALAALPDGSVAAAGRRAAGGPHVARWNGSNWLGLDGGVAAANSFSYCEALSVSATGDVLVGGWFDRAGGQPSRYLARWTTACSAAVGTSGNGCAGSAGLHGFAVVTTPWVGSTFVARATAMPAGLAVAVLGLGTQSLPLVSLLPQALPGCNLLVTPDVLGLLVPAGGTVDVVLPIPNLPTLAGLVVREQVVAFEIPMSGTIVAVSATDALFAQIGSY